MIFWISTGMILLSSLTMQLSLRSFKDREMSKYRFLIGVTVVLGAAFIICQWLGFQQLWEQKVTLKGPVVDSSLYVIFGLLICCTRLADF